jgi:drug/metabolite transporter superfamily protein YnfA
MDSGGSVDGHEALGVIETSEPADEGGAGTPVVDLAGLGGAYTARAPLRRRARRISIALIAVVVLAVGGWVAAQVIAGGPGEWRPALLSVLPGLAAGALPLVAELRPPRTVLSAEHLVVRTGFFTQRTLTWDQVLAVRRPGRWDVHSSAVLHDGTDLSLPGLDDQRAQRLVEVVARLHAEPGPPPSPAPRVDGTPAGSPVDRVWEGPFRTRRGRPGGEPDRAARPVLAARPAQAPASTDGRSRRGSAPAASSGDATT